MRFEGKLSAAILRFGGSGREPQSADSKVVTHGELKKLLRGFRKTRERER